MSYIPHTPNDVANMLAEIDVNNIAALFDEIPKDLKIHELSNIPESLNEMQAIRLAKEISSRDHYELNFIGAGAYEHHIPAAVWDLVSRGEFLTCYTPYQAEASQGTLQLLYEYQSMITSLTGMEVSNASMYDGATALAEAILMALRCRQKGSASILLPRTVHPLYRAAVETVAKNQGIVLIETPVDLVTGRMDQNALQSALQDDTLALVIPQPNFFGVLEEVDALTQWAAEKNLMSIAVVNPMSLGLLREPGAWGSQGADIVCGELQPFGMPLSSGGPYAGFLCCKQAYVRQMPGRIIGRTTDTQGRVGFTLTLQAREQHIRRAKATSNICTNQGLLVTAATVYLSLLGPEGLKRVAATSHANARAFAKAIGSVPGVQVRWQGPYFHELVLHADKPVQALLKALSDEGILGGFDLSEDYPELTNHWLVCLTETKTAEDITRYVEALNRA